DLWGDNVVHIAVFLGLGLGLTHDFQQARWLVLSGLASFGTLCAVSIVSWRTARQKRVGPLFTSVAGGDRPHDLSPWRQRLISVSDALARRDFVYGVFVLALIQRLEWFLWASAIGANLYTLTLLFLSKKQR
ncbi:MAG: hypothetical protein HYZ73_07720, partial [Elusimicrobia bacterium]|nr:hypothetical protein [Elusimicrobiota bacterium]